MTKTCILWCLNETTDIWQWHWVYIGPAGWCRRLAGRYLAAGYLTRVLLPGEPPGGTVAE